MAQEAEIPGAVVGGTYRLVRPLVGDTDQVYEARHDRLSGRFVVKLLADAEPDAFQRNAQLVSALRHPGVVQVIDYSAAEGQAFVVMEYIDGRPLSELIAETGLMPADRVARLIDNVAAALAAAHELGLAHGHLSPQRILVQAGGSRREKTKVIGLGLGSEISGVPDLTELTPYTAPEQAGDPPEPASDQFALAAIAYEMLTGFPPFDDSNDREEPASIRDYAPGVNVIVDDVIRRALATDPENRWADITTFAQRLREAGDSTSLEEKTRVTSIPLRPAPAELTPTPVDGLEPAEESFELPAPSTPLPLPELPELPPALAALDLDPGTPRPWSLSGTLGPRTGSYRVPQLPPPSGSTGFVLPPPSQPSLSVRRPPSYGGADSGPWTMAPSSPLGLSADGAGMLMAARRSSRRRRSTGGLLALGAAAAIVVFVLVKTDVFGTRSGATHASGHATPAPAAATPPPAAPPEVTKVAAEGAPSPSAPAPAPSTDEAPAAEGIGGGPAQPQVMPLAAETGPQPGTPRPRRRAAHRRHPIAGAPLPPELAAEEALLAGGPPIERRAAAKSRKKGVKHALRDTSASDPWAE